MPRLSLDALETRDNPTAQLQVVHDSPAAAVGTIDVYVNNSRVLDDVSFRQSSPFITVADSVPLKIDVVAGAAANNAAPLATQTVTLPASAKAAAAVVGVPGVTGDAAFKIALATNARTGASSAANADLLFLNGAPDAGPVDVKIRGIGTVANDVATGAFAADYVSVPAGQYILDFTAADGITPIGSYIADLTGAAGKAYVVAASGYRTRPATSDPAFAPVTVDATGTGTILPRTSGFAETRFAVGGVNTATLYTPTGQAVFTVTPFAAGITTRVAAADVTGDGVGDLVVGAGPGGASQVLVYDGVTQQVVRNFTAFEAAFTGGVFVAASDLDGDGFSDVVVTPDVTGGPRVQIRSGASGNQLVPDFFGIDDANFRGGARASFGDLNGDATPDLIIAAGFGGGPRVAAYNGQTLLPGGRPGKLFADFFVFEEALRNGAFVTSGDVDNDGYDDLIGGGGPGGGPRVYALSGRALTQQNGTQAPLANFFAGVESNRDGVRLTAKDLDGDYRADIVVGLGSPGVAQVRTFRGINLASAPGTNPSATLELNPLTSVPADGVFVG